MVMYRNGQTRPVWRLLNDVKKQVAFFVNAIFVYPTFVQPNQKDVVPLVIMASAGVR